MHLTNMCVFLFCSNAACSRTIAKVEGKKGVAWIYSVATRDFSKFSKGKKKCAFVGTFVFQVFSLLSVSNWGQLASL